MKSGFSIIEVLVVVAVICLLAAFLFPVITTARGNAYRTVCGSNLRQVGLVCQAYANDSRGMLPQCNSSNPSSFKYPMGEVLDRYMKENNIPPQIWYCPVIDSPKRTPDLWMNPANPWDSFGEFPIGYFYVGNPSSSFMNKFVKPVPLNINNYNANIEFIFDFCAAPSGTTDPSLVDYWYYFSHFGRNNPDGAQVMMGDFSVEYRNMEELTIGYNFSNASAFW